MVSFNIGAMLHKPQGVKEHFDLDVPFVLKEKGDPELTANIQAGVTFLKLAHEVNVQLRNLHTTASCTCSRCLTSFNYMLDIPFAEREFIIDLHDRDLEPGEDVFYVDKHTNRVVLDDMIREEILLHFPTIPVCSQSCKGLCDQCGTNLNISKCSCSSTKKTTNAPFHLLNS